MKSRHRDISRGSRFSSKPTKYVKVLSLHHTTSVSSKSLLICFSFSSLLLLKLTDEPSKHFMVGNSAVDTLLFADDQAILTNSESGLQMTRHLSLIHI